MDSNGHPFTSVTLLFPADVPVVAGQWRRRADRRIEARLAPHELELVLRLTAALPATVQEHLAAARQAPAPIVLPPEPPAPPEPPEEPRPDAVEVGEMTRDGQLVLM